MAVQGLSYKDALSQLPYASNTISHFPKRMANLCVLVYVVALVS